MLDPTLAMQLSTYSLMASLMLVVLALACYILALALGRSVRPAPVMAHAGVGARRGRCRTLTDRAPAQTLAGCPQAGRAVWRSTAPTSPGSPWCSSPRAWSSGRSRSGHGPFANQYEFSVAFAWGMIAAYVYFEHRYHVRTIALLILPITAGILLYAMTVGDTANPLVPALQNNLLLTTHVVLAIIAYGAFAVSFAAAVLYLIQPEEGRRGLPKPALLDEIGYRAVIIGFPLDTMMVILGAVWADVAWGTYWSWDPKETASLLTWLVYGAYLHARVARGWRGRRAAWLLMLGFAAVAFTFFGNLFFTGLHSYGK